MAVAKEAKHKAEVKTSCLEVKWTSILLELGAAKDEVSSLHSRAGKDKEAMEKDYQKAMKLIFVYGYRCCVFKHNICGDQPEVPDGMPDSFDQLPPEFFVNPRCPPAPIVAEVTITKVDQSKATKELEKSASTRNQG